MKSRIVKRFAAIFLLCVGATSALADFQVGLEAAQNGDYKTAFQEWAPQAEQGPAILQFSLGYLYAEGKGVRQNYTKALKLLQKAAEGGSDLAQAYLGNMYNDGVGVEKNYVQAAKWYRMAAEQGHAESQFSLGYLYSIGAGVDQDKAATAKWYLLAAEQGDVDAQYNLGTMYSDGFGVRQNQGEAVKWYRLAADQGDDGAELNLGVQYVNGLGVPQDFVIAYSWFSLAAAQGNQQAIKNRNQVIGEMSSQQVSEGQSMSRSWYAGKYAASLVDTSQHLASLSGSKQTFPTTPVAVRFAKTRPRPDDIAVIIGNANYEKGRDIPNVNPAYADAAGIRKYVTQVLGIQNENIIFLKDATQAKMISTFGSTANPKGQLYNYVKPGKSRVFVYYSGHGAPGGADGSSYIVPTDAEASLIDLNGYSLKTLYKNLSKIPAKSMTVVLEACFSGASQSGSVIAKASPIYLKVKETGIPSNITVIAAGAANQIASWEQDSSSGLFTKYFLKGMSGEADAKPYGNGDGKVGYDELGRYFNKTLTYFARRYYGREQTAQIVMGQGR